MIIVKIIGGLASQMQQFSIGQALAKACGTEFYMDLSDYVNGYFRPFALADLNLEDAHILRDGRMAEQAIRVTGGRQLEEEFARTPVRDLWLTEEASSYRAFFNAHPELYPDVNAPIFQSVALKDPEASGVTGQLRQMAQENTLIGVHVRLGDFVTIGWNDSYEGYRAAIGHLMQKHPDAKVIFFSNEIDRVEREFGPRKEFYYIKNRNGLRGDAEDFMSLALCREKVISTSSGYSRYAAYIGMAQWGYGKAVCLKDNSKVVTRDCAAPLSEEEYKEGLRFFAEKFASRTEEAACCQELGAERAAGLDRTDLTMHPEVYSPEERKNLWSHVYPGSVDTDSIYVLQTYRPFNRWSPVGAHLAAMILARLGCKVLYVNCGCKDDFKLGFDHIAAGADMDGVPTGVDMYLTRDIWGGVQKAIAAWNLTEEERKHLRIGRESLLVPAQLFAGRVFRKLTKKLPPLPAMEMLPETFRKLQQEEHCVLRAAEGASLETLKKYGFYR